MFSIVRGLILVTCFLIAAGKAFAMPKAYTTYLWHLQQPIYWPAKHPQEDRYQYVWDSMQLKGSQNGHPLNNLGDIFGKDDRIAVYQWRIRDVINAMSNHPDAGVQTNYSGCLAENVKSLGDNYALGYSPDWNKALQESRRMKTSGGLPKNDIVLFTYHHALPGLIDPMMLKREIQIYKAVYGDLWGTDVPMSKGFFPAEIAFSERNIPVLAELGIEWTIVSNSHISRAVSNFPLVLGTGGENTEPPNKADQINPPQDNWWRVQIDRGCSPTNAYPYSMRPHYAKYVDPETGEESKIIVVPAEQAMSWKDGYATYGTQDIDSMVSAVTDKPMLFVFAHDGDNAFGGGFSYYMENVPRFANEAASKGYRPSTVQQFLRDNPVDPNDIVHVEDGAWVNADGDMGSPTFSNWNWPLMGQNGKVDIENGWAEDERNWAVYTAALNRVMTAENLHGEEPNYRSIAFPQYGANDLEKAWHFLLGGTASGYMYYGKALDMELKPTIACNDAVDFADRIIGRSGTMENTAPTIWIPQRYPYNPGSLNYGAIYKYKKYFAPPSFWVWTFIYDVSGVKTVKLKYRVDKDGVNPLSSNQNEVFADGNEVGVWKELPMTLRNFPLDNFFNDPEIVFSTMPKYIADQYFVYVDEEELKNVLVDYYVEAKDSLGNVSKSPIQHVWIGDGEGSSQSDSTVTWEPKRPTCRDTLTVRKKFNSSFAGDEVFLHWGVNSWNLPPGDLWSPETIVFDDQSVETPMVKLENNVFEIKIDLSKNSDCSVEKLDFVFHYGNSWDNNNGQDYLIRID